MCSASLIGFDWRRYIALLIHQFIQFSRQPEHLGHDLFRPMQFHSLLVSFVVRSFICAFRNHFLRDIVLDKDIEVN